MTETQTADVKKRYSWKLLQRPEVCGVGVTQENGSDEYVLAVFLTTEDTPELRQRIAEDLAGHPFKVIVTGPFNFQLA